MAVNWKKEAVRWRKAFHALENDRAREKTKKPQNHKSKTRETVSKTASKPKMTKKRVGNAKVRRQNQLNFDFI